MEAKELVKEGYKWKTHEYFKKSCVKLIRDHLKI